MLKIIKQWDVEEAYNTAVGGLSQFFHNPEDEDYVPHVLVGISGGIDSALVATIAVDAFGADHVHGVIIPANATSEKSVELAMQLGDNLGIDIKGVPIGAIGNNLVADIGSNIGCELSGLTKGNVFCRLRMVILMAIANEKSYALLNTGNRTESMLGYCTLYGDTAGVISPIGDFFKTEVFELAKFANKKWVGEGCLAPIPEEIITRPPTAELVEGQTDEEDLGGSYEIIDNALFDIFVCQMTAEEAPKKGYDTQFCAELVARHNANRFKLNYVPPHTIYHREIPDNMTNIQR